MPNIILETRGLCKRYGALTAVKDLTLQVFEGEVFGFLGPNGAGKTTSIHMMCGLLQPDAGQVCLHGKTISSGDTGMRSRVGVCPQEIVIWKQLTCLEQLQFTGEMYGMRSRKARERGLQLLEDLGLAEKRDQQARALSGGMQRRLNLALALVHEPELIILDEPEAGLDPQSRVRVRDYIRSLARRRTIILTTHNMDEAERTADRVAIIDRGELLVLDTPQALKRRLGEGDVLEIKLEGQAGDPRQLSEALERLPGKVEAYPGHEALSIRGLDLVNRLPSILVAARKAGYPCGEVRLRANTLEDVFIQLTGRGLRG